MKAHRGRIIVGCLAFLVPMLLNGCGSGTMGFQEAVLGPYQVGIRLGEDLAGKAEQQTDTPGVYEYEEVGPHFVQRRVRYGAQMDRIVWIEVEDRPIETEAETEHALFDAEIERLQGFLGEPHRREGDRRTGTRLVRWDFPGGEAVEMRLSTVGRDNRSVRQLIIGRVF